MLNDSKTSHDINYKYRHIIKANPLLSVVHYIILINKF